jgi:hypothetical protein
VAPKVGGRRLLGLSSASTAQLIDVHMVVHGAEGLRSLHSRAPRPAAPHRLHSSARCC